MVTDLSSVKTEEVENNTYLEIKPDARQVPEEETDAHSEVKIDAPQLEIKSDEQPVAKVDHRPYKDNPYYKLLLLLLYKFKITDHKLESFNKNESDKKVIKRSAFFELNEIAQKEILFIQKANAESTEYCDPITFVNLKRILGEPVDVPLLFDIAAANYDHLVKKTNPEATHDELIIEIRERIDTLKSNFAPSKVSLRKERYIEPENEGFEFILFYNSELTTYIELLMCSTVAVNELVVNELWTKEIKSPIHLAAAFGNASILQSLIIFDDNRKEAIDRHGLHPIHYAIGFNNLDALEELIKHNVSLKPNNNCTPPLHFAIKFDRTKMITHLWKANKMAENPIDINAVDSYGQTMFFVACSRGSNASVKWLLKHGADVTIPNNSGMLPIHVACLYGHAKVVETLLEKFPGQANAPDKYGESPLHYATQRGFIKLAKILTENNAKPVAFSNDNKTPFSVISDLKSKKVQHEMQQVLVGTNNSVINDEMRIRNKLTHLKRVTNIVPSILGVLTFVGLLVWGIFSPELDVTARLLVIIFGPLIVGGGLRQLGMHYYVEPLEVRLLAEIKRQANTENVVENDIENDVNNTRELSAASYAKVIPIISKEVADKKSQREFDASTLNLEEEESLKDSRVQPRPDKEEESEEVPVKPGKEEESEEETVLSVVTDNTYGN